MSILALYEEQQKIEKASERLQARQYRLKEKLRDLGLGLDEVTQENGRLFRTVRNNGLYSIEIEEVKIV